jgi:hypothetical protein
MRGTREGREISLIQSPIKVASYDSSLHEREKDESKFLMSLFNQLLGFSRKNKAHDMRAYA